MTSCGISPSCGRRLRRAGSRFAEAQGSGVVSLEPMFASLTLRSRFRCRFAAEITRRCAASRGSIETTPDPSQSVESHASCSFCGGSGGEFLALSPWSCMRLRVRWGLVGKWGALLLGGIVVLKLLPGLLEPPAPAPLPADVGLPQVASPAVELKRRPPRARLGRVARGGGVRAGRRPVFRPDRKLGRQTAPRRKTQPGADTPTPRQDPPAETPVPAVPLPPPPPEPPNDGSAEFAPH
jgi:hypothetical protein